MIEAVQYSAQCSRSGAQRYGIHHRHCCRLSRVSQSAARCIHTTQKDSSDSLHLPWHLLLSTLDLIPGLSNLKAMF